MLVISNKQIVFFEKKSLDDYFERVIFFIKQQHEEVYLDKSNEEWKKWLNEKINEARNYKLVKELQTLEYIDLSLSYKEMTINPKPKWILEILNHPNKKGDRKIEILIERLNFNK